MLEMPARCTSEEICLHAVAMEESTTVSSLSITCSLSFWKSHVISVVEHYPSPRPLV
jgi:hypothetical protein